MAIIKLSDKTRKNILQILRLLFFLGLGFFFIWLFLRNLSVEEKQDIIGNLKNANYNWILLSIVFGFISNMSRSARWKILMETMGYKPRFYNVFMSVFIAYFANLALPRLGEVSRCLPLAKYEKIPFEKSFGTVVTERAFDMIVFIILFVINVFLQFSRLWGYLEEKVLVPLQEKFTALSSLTNILILITIVLLGVAVLFLIFRNKNSKFLVKVKKTISGFADGLKSILYIKRPWAFILHTLNIWFMYLLMTVVVFRCLPATASLGVDAAFSVLMLGSIGIMVVQGGIGIYPAIVAETLTLYGVFKTTGYAMGWLLWTGQTSMIIIAGLISLVLLPIVNRKNHGKINGVQE